MQLRLLRVIQAPAAFVFGKHPAVGTVRAQTVTNLLLHPSLRKRVIATLKMADEVDVELFVVERLYRGEQRGSGRALRKDSRIKLARGGEQLFRVCVVE